MDGPHDGSSRVAGYGREARNPAACSKMALEFTASTFLGVAGMFVYWAVTRRMDGGAVLEPCVRNVVTNTG